VAVASNYIFGTLLTANGDLKALNIVAFSGMVGNIILNLILIPKYMVLGAALASLITQIFTSSIQFILVVVNFKFKFNWNLILRFAVYLLLLLPLMKLISDTNLSLYLKFGLEIALFTILVSLSGIISPRSFYLLIKKPND
jgi:O-antigen/teichoic acid export membrane protein